MAPHKTLKCTATQRCFCNEKNACSAAPQRAAQTAAAPASQSRSLRFGGSSSSSAAIGPQPPSAPVPSGALAVLHVPCLSNFAPLHHSNFPCLPQFCATGAHDDATDAEERCAGVCKTVAGHEEGRSVSKPPPMPHLDYAICVEDELPCQYNYNSGEHGFFDENMGVWLQSGGQKYCRGELLRLVFFSPKIFPSAP